LLSQKINLNFVYVFRCKIGQKMRNFRQILTEIYKYFRKITKLTLKLSIWLQTMSKNSQKNENFRVLFTKQKFVVKFLLELQQQQQQQQRWWENFVREIKISLTGGRGPFLVCLCFVVFKKILQFYFSTLFTIKFFYDFFVKFSQLFEQFSWFFITF